MLFKEEDGKYVSNVGNKSEEIPNARRLARKCGVPISLEVRYCLICDGMDKRMSCVRITEHISDHDRWWQGWESDKNNKRKRGIKYISLITSILT
jgi:hypothetical protein